ncbi:DUF2750 domain-containing protein [Hymenobacter sp. HDW8]|uniref:DUF2750 domain-containing protein n=1 Tax=Hymenobacter sp. HDW8 TaxID=2714932 RepID=UPI00140CFB5E|nr:DUF2750 domain-containing protein [Hymenobacter sp. HDW8]QIL78373.1 DUF2750 domain-containing protein [Hymenobacter sp. HDW8]
MNTHKLQNILNLPAQERYGYFIRKAVDFEAVWLVKDKEGVVMLGDDSGSQCLPVWPEKAFAEQHITGDWESYLVEEMRLEDFLDWLEELQEERIHIAAFPKEDLQGVVVEAQEMKSHLLHELEQYE